MRKYIATIKGHLLVGSIGPLLGGTFSMDLAFWLIFDFGQGTMIVGFEEISLPTNHKGKMKELAT